MNQEEIAKRCASCFVFNGNDILLIYHKKFGKYLQPGGHIEGNEKGYETAIRETLQETGVVVEIIDKVPFNKEIYNTPIGKQLDEQYIGIPLNLDLKNNEKEAFLCGWFNIYKLNELPIVDDLMEKIQMIKSRR